MLARALERKPLEVDPRPVEPDSIVEVVSVTPHPIFGTPHHLATRLCRALDSRPAVEALGEEAASVGWLGHCPSHAATPARRCSIARAASARSCTVARPGCFQVGVTSGL